MISSLCLHIQLAWVYIGIWDDGARRLIEHPRNPYAYPVIEVVRGLRKVQDLQSRGLCEVFLQTAQKKSKKAKREQNKNILCTYIRGLRVFQDGKNTKFVDRDVNGSINIGIIWIGDHIKGRKRPDAFIRIVMTPCSKQQVRAEKGHTAVRDGNRGRDGASSSGIALQAIQLSSVDLSQN